MGHDCLFPSTLFHYLELFSMMHEGNEGSIYLLIPMSSS